MPQPRLYSQMKKKLRARGIGPLSKRLWYLRGPSIPEMYPSIKGANASNYQRVGKPQINQIRGPPKTVLERVSTGRIVDTGLGFYGRLLPEYRTVPKVVPGDVVGVTTKYRLKRLSRRGGSGKGGGGGERGSHATGSAVAKRARRKRAGGTRGARPRREEKKQVKK